MIDKFYEDDWVWDIETYPNIVTFAFYCPETKEKKLFEVSRRKDEINEFIEFCRVSKRNDYRWVGYNSLGFDYVVVHWILGKAKEAKTKGIQLKLTANSIYKYAMKVISSYSGGGYGMSVRAKDIIIKQLDLYKMNHYDNDAKRTSLKLLEFNMRLPNISDLPFPVGKTLTLDEMDVLVEYNFDDVYATTYFYEKCHSAIKFRSELSEKYGFDCTNLNDGKIGEKFFMQRIEADKPDAFYIDTGRGKKVRQTVRESVFLGDCLFPYIQFVRPEFLSILNWFRQKTIYETKGSLLLIEEHLLGDVAKYCELITKSVKLKGETGVDVDKFMLDHPMGWIECRELKSTVTLKDENGVAIKKPVINDKGKEVMRVVKVPAKAYYGCYRLATCLNTVIDGFRYDYGTGGIHGSICGVVEEDSEHELWDWDVKSFYPNMAIANRIYPEHLGEGFCDSYGDFYKERSNYAKGTGENLAIKLGLNTVYGQSNSEFSPFFDSKYTMSITVGGQLSLCMLIERLIDICGVRIIQANTDGFTVKVKKTEIERMKHHVQQWEKATGLEMEYVKYTKMYVADVNSYVAFYDGGGLKSKGRYNWTDLKNQDLGSLHKDHSAIVVQMAVESEITGGVDAATFIRNHDDPYDFMLRVKVPRSSSLVLEVDSVDEPQQNMCRYYASMCGGELVKIMPPLEGKEEYRRMGVEKGQLVKTCNDINDFKWDIDYEYYIEAANKLLEPFQNKVYG